MEFFKKNHFNYTSKINFIFKLVQETKCCNKAGKTKVKFLNLGTAQDLYNINIFCLMLASKIK